MEDRVFKIAMLHLDNTVAKIAANAEDIQKIRKLIDIVKGDNPEDLPDIKNTEDFYEAAKTLEMSKHDFPRVIMDILRSADTSKLPSGLVGDIGEYLGEIKGIGLIPDSLLERTFLKEDLANKVIPKKWEFFFKDENKLKKLKEQKGF